MDFPTDVLVEILQRLPTSARRRARLVCRLWREAVDEHTTEMQSRAKPLLWNTRTSIAYLDDFSSSSTGRFTMVWKSSGPCAFSYGDADQQLVGTCNGLLCLCDNGGRTGGEVTLINPATREALPVPPLPRTDQLFGCRGSSRRWDMAYSFGYHPTTGRYKLVHVPCRFDDRFNDAYGVVRDFDALQVLELGEEPSWREVPAPGDARCNLEAGIVSVDGATYWVTEGGPATARVLSLSLDDERVVAFAMPSAALSAGPGNYHLAEVRGRLGVAVRDRSAGSTTGVWVMEKGTWTRRYILHSLELTRPQFVFGDDVVTEGQDRRSLHGHRRKSDWSLPCDVVKISDKDQGTLVARSMGETCFCRTFAYVRTTEPLDVYAARPPSTAALNGGGDLHQTQGSEQAQLGGLQSPPRTAVAALARVTLARVEPEAPVAVFVLLLALCVLLLAFCIA